MDFSAELLKRTEYANKVIKDFLVKEEGEQKTVLEAVNYSVLAGGKRLRPILMLEAFKLFDDKENHEILKPFMAAIEMIHTYSLVHDDLPAMDNDRYRRGKLTTHAAYGEAMGVLAGDALLNYAFECVLNAYPQVAERLCFDKTMADRYIRALQVLSVKSGLYGMLGGQSVDVENTGKEVSLKLLDFIYELKTGALLEAAMVCGAILAGASEENISYIDAAAKKIGIAFQYFDDVLDVTSTEEVLGKPVHSDEKNNKTTSVTFFGVDGAKKMAEEAYGEAIGFVDRLPGDKSFLKELMSYMVKREK